VIHLAGPGRLVAVLVTVNGHLVRAHVEGRDRVFVNLGRPTRGRFTVRIIGRLRDGTRRFSVRHLRACPRSR
jgi:hypothetical protein